jgi:hypothetical protein
MVTLSLFLEKTVILKKKDIDSAEEEDVGKSLAALAGSLLSHYLDNCASVEVQFESRQCQTLTPIMEITFPSRFTF